MVTRQERIDAFTHQGAPPANQPLEVLCEDHVGTYVIPFLCRWSSGAWPQCGYQQADRSYSRRLALRDGTGR
jgi:hypothetical protein